MTPPNSEPRVTWKSGRSAPSEAFPIENGTEGVSVSTDIRWSGEALSDIAVTETPILDQLGRDLTDLARKGEFQGVVVREEIILRLARALLRKEKANPVLIGEPGVGKTAIVEGLSTRLLDRSVDARLGRLRIVELPVASLIAGTAYRGQMEERLLSILAELRSNDEVVLFLDEIHLVVGAGQSEGGTVDIANILKPALARGDVRCIGATTPSEFARAMRSDRAFERRFIPIRVDEPTEEETLALLVQTASEFRDHYDVDIDTAAFKAAVSLSVRYMPDRRLPDKAFDLLDDACVRVALPELARRDHATRLVVTAQEVSSAVAERTGIPMAHLESHNRPAVIDVEKRMLEQVIGQAAAVKAVASTVKVAELGLRSVERPRGVFLFGGPTGVGKTALARALALSLFGDERSLVRIDMSEYQERHSVSRLLGSPPGYIGSEEEGQLAKGLGRNPYSVVLLDEIEKAHPHILDVFLQVFDAGRVTDASGKVVDARHAYFVMTTNLAVTESQDILRQHLRHEFLNRIDHIVKFEPLTAESLFRIGQKEIQSLNQSLRSQSVTLEVNRAAMEYLCRSRGDGDSVNGRTVIRRIEQEITVPLARLLEEHLTGNGEISMQIWTSLVDGEIRMDLTEGTDVDDPVKWNASQ